jgi:hypothetical protein
MALRLRLTTRDRRSGADPVALIDVESNTLLSCHRTSGGALKAQVILNQVHPYARELSAAELHEVVASRCAELFATRAYAKLPPHQLNRLIDAVRAEFRARREY